MGTNEQAWRSLRSPADWRAFLTAWNSALLQDGEIRDKQPAEVLSAGWLGYPGASETQIAAAEARLGTHLPPSYRMFLQVTNGWRDIGPFIYHVWSAEEIEWFPVRNASWIDTWEEGASYYPDEEPLYESLHMRATLEISDEGDAAILLLNPRVTGPQGEWEAWFFSNWNPGANIYPSFRALMLGMYDTFLRLRSGG